MSRFIFATVLIALVVAVGAGGALAYRAHYGPDPAAVLALTDAYATYKQYEQQRFAAALAPGRGENTLRQQLNTTLAKTLTGKIGTSTRHTLSERGLEQVAAMRERVSNMEAHRLAVDDAIAGVERSAGALQDPDATQLADQMRERFKTIDRIKTLSKEITRQIESVFQRIDESGGRLTSEHVSELNASIPKAERRFDERVRLYDDLQELDADIERTYDRLTADLSTTTRR
jgi:hypothetical protein